MINGNNRPLVSFCQMCYNQKEYIISSLQGALAQTYSPLEIIISDDASTDNSWHLILDTVANYKGPHRIIINRNEQNLGLSGNWNKLCSLSHGELFFKGDGDDISLPNRVEKVVNEWIKHDKAPLLLSSSYIKIDMQGRQIGEYIMPINGWDDRDDSMICTGADFFHIGATSVYNRKLFDTFEPVMPKAAEDSTYTGRAVLLGRLMSVQEELVLYRVGSGNTTGKTNYRESMIKGINLGLYSRYQLLEDLESIKGQLSLERYEQMKGIFESSANQHKESLQLWSGTTFKERLSGYRRLYNSKAPFKIKYIHTVLLLPSTLSKLLFLFPFWIKKLIVLN